MSATALEWDYTELAPHYERRAPYAADTVARAVALGAPDAGRAADIGAGTGRFARLLHAAGYGVDAVEPNPAMRAVGAARGPAALRWHARDALHTGLPGSAFAVVSFASSFNVVAPEGALDEAARLLGAGGALLVLWNHRRLDDPVQAAVEAGIRRLLPQFAPGRRREDPALTIAAHAAFDAPLHAVLPLTHHTTVADFVEGFRAHATLLRQCAPALRPRVLQAIAEAAGGEGALAVPFETRLWVARRRA